MTRRAWVLFATVSLLWGVPYLFIKVAVAEVPPVTVVFVRVVLAALLLGPVAARRGALRGCAAASPSLLLAPFAVALTPARLPSLEVALALLALGVLCTAAGLLLFFALIVEAGPSRAAVITYMNPAVAVALGVIVLGEPLTGAIVGGVLLILVGSWLLNRRPGP